MEATYIGCNCITLLPIYTTSRHATLALQGLNLELEAVQLHFSAEYVSSGTAPHEHCSAFSSSRGGALRAILDISTLQCTAISLLTLHSTQLQEANMGSPGLKYYSV